MMDYDTEESNEFYLAQKVAYVSHQILSTFDDRLEAQDDIAIKSQYPQIIFKWSRRL